MCFVAHSMYLYLDCSDITITALTETFFFGHSRFLCFLAFNFCRFCMVICFFIPATTANDLRLQRISIPDLIHYIYFPILILEKEPVFPFSMLSAKQGNYWYHFYNVFGMTRSLNASTLPLGYRGGGT